MEGRGGVEFGGFAFLRDLSRLSEGEEALLAARERREGAVGLEDRVSIYCSFSCWIGMCRQIGVPRRAITGTDR